MSVVVHRSSLNDPNERPWGWLMEQEKAGGMLGAVGAHYLDALRWWFGEVKAVAGAVSTMVRQRRLPDSSGMAKVDADDNFSVILRFANGALGTIHITATSGHEGDEEITLSGSEGTLQVRQGRLWGARLGEFSLNELPIPERLTGGLVHVVNHALMKAALFLAVGAIFYRARTVELEDLAGIGRRMPLTMAAFAIAGFGLVGTPGTVGFISKWYLAVGALDNGWWVLVFLIVASSLVALVYVGRVLEVAWLREPPKAMADVRDPPPSMLLPLLVLAAATIYFGIDTEWSAGIAARATEVLLGGLR